MGERKRMGWGPSLLLILTVAAGWALPPGIAAQTPDRHTVILRGVPVTEALAHVASVTGMDLLFGSEVAEASGDEEIFCRLEGATAEAILECVVRGAGLDFYRLSSGTYVVIARPEDAPAYGTLVGVVTDGWSGQPLPNAQVEFADVRRPTRSNPAGLFAVPALLPGRHQVMISAPGYRSQVMAVDVPPRGEARVTFALEAQPFRARPLVVDGISAGRGSLVGRGGSTLDRQALLDSGEGAGGFSRALLRMPGVVPRPLLSDVLIQGGGAGEQQLRLDGAPVYNPLAVEGLLGTFSPLALERVTVRKAGFPARHGSAISGILDFEHANGAREGFGSEVQIDPFNLNGRITIPLTREQDPQGGLMIAGRRTLWGLAPTTSLERALREWNQVDPLLTAALRHQAPDGAEPPVSEAVVYQDHGHGSELQSSDLHVAARIPTGPGRSLRASIYGGSNEVSTRTLAAGHHEGAPDADRIMVAQDAYDWTNLAGQIRHDALLGSRSAGGIQLRGSRHVFRSGFQMVTDGADLMGPGTQGLPGAEATLLGRLGTRPAFSDRTGMTEVAGELTLERVLGPGHQLHLTLEGVRSEATVSLQEGLFPDLHTRAAHTRVALATEDRWSRGGWTLEGGLRTTWLPGTDGLWAEPRGSVELQGENRSLGAYGVRFAGGVFRQYVNQLELANPGPSALVPSVRFWLPVEEGVAPPRAAHLALEATLAPTQEWEVRGEVYGKRTRDLPEIDYATLLLGGWSEERVDPSFLVESTRGSTVGMGVRFRRSGDQVRIQAGYDATRSRRIFPSRFGGEAVPDPGDAPHRGLIRVEAAPRPDLLLRARGTGVWGRSWAFRRAYYDLLTVHEPRPELGVGRPGDQTLPPLLELDLGASWSLRRGETGVELSADLLNVLNRRNVLDYGLRRRSEDQAGYDLLPRFLTGFTPAISIRAVF